MSVLDFFVFVLSRKFLVFSFQFIVFVSFYEEISLLFEPFQQFLVGGT